MDISSVASTLVTSNIPTQNNKETERVEGNKPDGDGDRDDAIQGATSKQATTALATSGTVGTKLNVTA